MSEQTPWAKAAKQIAATLRDPNGGDGSAASWDEIIKTACHEHADKLQAERTQAIKDRASALMQLKATALERDALVAEVERLKAEVRRADECSRVVYLQSVTDTLQPQLPQPKRTQ